MTVTEETISHGTDALDVALRAQAALASLTVARLCWARGELHAAAQALRMGAVDAEVAIGTRSFAKRLTARLTAARSVVAEWSTGSLPSPARLGEAIAAYEMAVDHTTHSRIRRRLRLASIVVGLGFSIAYLAFAVGLRPFANVRASGVFYDDPVFAASHAFDGRPDTEWLAPDGPHASLDVYPFPPRRVRALVVHNGHNRHFLDRGVRDATVSLFRDGVLVERLTVHFDQVRHDGETKVLPLRAEVAGVDHVQVEIRSVHGLGAALGDIELR